jgi:hypothetical protein
MVPDEENLLQSNLLTNRTAIIDLIPLERISWNVYFGDIVTVQTYVLKIIINSESP